LDREKELETTDRKLEEHIFITSKIKDELRIKSNIHTTIEKFEELCTQIEELTNSKIEIEEHNIRIQEDSEQVQLKFEIADTKRIQAEELLFHLKTGTQTELSNRIIEISDKMASLRLIQLRAERENSVLKEKELHLQRLNQNHLVAIRKLEEEYSSLESKYHQKDEEWRKRDNERQQFFFDLQHKDRLKEKSYDTYSSKIIMETDEDDFGLFKKRLDGEEHRNFQQQIQELTERLKSAHRELDTKDRMIKQWQSKFPILPNLIHHSGRQNNNGRRH